MENDKMYYVPDITQLFVGYICEIYKPDHLKLGAQGYWKQVKIGDIGQGTDIIPLTKFRNLKKENRIRTKYLDEEDIISLGFVKRGEEKIQLTWNNEFNFSENYFEYKDWSLQITKYSDDSTNIVIWNDSRSYWEPYFEGELTSINELNKILKLLKIK